MKQALILRVGLLAVAIFMHTTAVAAVEYVRICSLYGKGFYYIPGTSQCINASTGTIITNTEQGPISSTSALAIRVAQLEARLQQVYQQFGIQSPEMEPIANK